MKEFRMADEGQQEDRIRATDDTEGHMPKADKPFADKPYAERGGPVADKPYADKSKDLDQDDTVGHMPKADKPYVDRSGGPQPD
jgi:hypothetical protein